MARKTNENSTRQKAFARLDALTGLGRKEAAETLMSEFSIGRSYAMTIYQQHRNAQKKSGKYTAVYTIRDTKDNKSVRPFMATTHVLKPTSNDSTTPESAVAAYINVQHDKVRAARDLDIEPIAEAAVDVQPETVDNPWKVLDGEGAVVSEHSSRSKARAVKGEGQKVSKQ